MEQNEIRLSFDGQVNASINNEIPYYIVELSEKIAIDQLEKAVFFAIEQHPTFHTKLVKKKKLYYLKYNELLPVIKESSWEKAITYGTEEYHYYPWIITTNDTKLLFTCAHLLCDGSGAMSFLSTVLTRYYYLLGAVSDETMKNFVAGDDKKKRRCEESFSASRVKNAKTPYQLRKYKSPPSLKKSIIEKSSDKLSVVRFRIPEEEITKLAQKTETTSFAVITSILAKAMQNALAIKKGNIQILLPVNLRGKYGSETDLGFVHTQNLYYDCEKFYGKSLELTSTAFRSQLDLMIDKEYLDYVVDDCCKQMDLVEKHPIILKVATLAFYNMLYAPKASLVYTHLTKVDFCREVKQHIKDLYISGTQVSTGLIVAMAVTFNDEISISMGQALKDNVLINELEKVLQEYGVRSTVSENPQIASISHTKTRITCNE